MNFVIPAEISSSFRTGISPPVHNPAAAAGSLTIFLEATQHGTLPWTGQGERRALLYRYSPRHLNFANATHVSTQPVSGRDRPTSTNTGRAFSSSFSRKASEDRSRLSGR